MPARVTLGTTALLRPLTAGASVVQLVSTSGVLPGKYLYFDGELCRVVALVPDGVQVQRGLGGTSVLPHASNVTVYIGDGDQFYQTDPVGRPPETFEVSPWINVRNGTVWFAQGDNDPVGLADRWWQKQTTAYDQGALGISTKTLSPTSST
jgi:hypothetical protein